MQNSPDIAIVDLHRMGSGPQFVTSIEGPALFVRDTESAEELREGQQIDVGDTIALEAGTVVQIGQLTLNGGRQGRAHTFVGSHAFQNSPSRADVPKLLEELQLLEEQLLAQLGEDPLASQEAPKTDFERSLASDFAFQNMVREVASELDELTARNLRSVCLFLHGDAACVAVSEFSLKKMRDLMSALQRPIQPHMVDAQTLDAILGLVYDGMKRA